MLKDVFNNFLYRFFFSNLNTYKKSSNYIKVHEAKYNLYIVLQYRMAMNINKLLHFS